MLHDSINEKLSFATTTHALELTCGLQSKHMSSQSLKAVVVIPSTKLYRKIRIIQETIHKSVFFFTSLDSPVRT